MTILVTGGGGFLGSHVVDRLRATGEDPFVASRSEHDLVDPSASRRLFEAARPEVVFHLAQRLAALGRTEPRPVAFGTRISRWG